MPVVRKLLLLCALVYATTVSAQIQLTDAPKDGAFLAQNIKSKSANYLLTGVVKDTTYPTLFIKVYQSGYLLSRVKVRLVPNGSQTSFRHMVFLPAGKYIYKIRYELIGKSIVIKDIDDVVVGDVFLIQGQSNAVAASYNKFDTSYYDKYCRSYGTSSTNGAATNADTNWYRTYADGAYNRGSVGQWGAVMAQVLVDSFSVPICLINGAVGGTRITQHQRDPNNPTNLNTIYGRLLYRVRKAKLDQNIRGILYFQGESDGPYAERHDTLFQKLHSFWKTDYPSFEKLYVIQVRAGCGGPTIQLRNKQRLFEEVLPNCQTLSANGLNNHDGCHYGFTNGYELLGHQMSALLGRDFYGSNRKHINAPTIHTCQYSNSDQTELTLKMKYPGDSIFADSSFTKLFRIEGDPSVVISRGYIRNNEVVLRLNKSSCAITGLTYDGLARTQPWVKGKTEMGLVSFYNVPITLNKPTITYQTCKNEIVDIGVSPVSGCSYVWQELPSGRRFSTSKATIKAYDSTTFLFVTNYASSACITSDSTYVTVLPDSITVPNLGSDIHLCTEDEVTFKPDPTGFAYFKWTSDKSTVHAFEYVSDSAEMLALIAVSKQGCSYRDTVEVTFSNPKIQLPKMISVCPNQDTLIKVAENFKSYLWNDIPGGDNYRASKGEIELIVTDEFGCTTSDSMTISEYNLRTPNTTKADICAGDSVIINKPQDVSKWYYNSVEITDHWVMTSSITSAVNILDSNGCWSVDSVQIKVNKLPNFDLGKDTGFCLGQSITLARPKGEKFYWQNELVQSNQINVDVPNTYSALLADSNGCVSSDTISIWQHSLPGVKQFYDTIICVDSTWVINLPDSTTYTVNGTLVSEKLVIADSGRYEIIAKSKYGCLSSKIIEVKTIKCGLSAQPMFDISTTLVYPNPFTHSITIKRQNKPDYVAKLFASNGVLVSEFNLIVDTNTCDLSYLNAGFYYLKIDNEVFRIVKL